MKTKEPNLIHFKSIPGYEGLYSVTSNGLVYRHLRKGTKPGFLKLRFNTTYLRVPLWKDGTITFHHVHRLVAMAFIPNPKKKPQVNHKNMNKHDNRVDNLEWVTWRENWQHARNNGRFTGKMISEEQQKELYDLYLTGNYTYQQLANEYGISLSSVGRHIAKHKKLKSAA